MSESTKIVDVQADWNDFLIKLVPCVVGKEPDDLMEQCLSLCQKYLAGIWTDLKIEDIDVKRLTSGMSNQTYHCKIRNTSNSDVNEVQEVVIRMYGEFNKIDIKTFEPCDNKIEEGIVGLMASELGVGPKIYGLYKTGQVMRYYPHCHFSTADLQDKSSMEQMATNLAKFHSMRPPVAKDFSAEHFIRNNIRIFGPKFEEKQKLFKEFNLKTLLEIDLKAESNWLFEKVKYIGSPIVFSHTDYRCGNTMLTEDKKVVLHDFELSCYFCRGYDFATFFNGFEKLDGKEYEFKDESVIKEFVAIYLKEGQKIYGKQYSDNKINSVEHILLEIKVLSLVNFMFASSALLNNDFYKLPMTEKTCLSTVEIQLKKYMAAKNLVKDI